MIKRGIQFLTAGFLCLGIQQGSAQEWVEKMRDPSVNFYEVVEAYEAAHEGKTYERGRGMKQFERWREFMEPRVYPSGERWAVTAAYDAIQAYAKNNRIQSGNKAANWQELGPTNWQSFSYNPGTGRVNAVRVDPNDSNRIYIGTPAGGAWKSNDHGQTWAPLTDDLPVIGVTDIAINPNNSNEVYISTGDGYGGDTYSLGVLKSTDQGQTWNTTGLNFFRSQNVRSRKLLMNPQNTDVLWVATGAGLFKTNDGGTSWTSVLAGDVRSVKMKPGDSTIVYACTDQFYRSTDGGNTFSLVSSSIASPAAVNRMEIAVSEASPNYVYALTGKSSDASFEGLYLSVNSGQSFIKMASSPNLFSYDMAGNNSGGQSWYDMAIAVNQSDANEVYVGGINVWKSTTAGSTWNITSHWVYPNNTGYTHADIHALEWYNGELYCGSDGGIFHSLDNASNWTDLSDGLQIMQFYKMAQTEQDSKIILGGAQDNGCNLRNAQENWVHVLGADGMDVAIDPSNASTLYFSSQNGNIRRSYNGGSSSTGISGSIRNSENGAWVTPYQIDPNNNLALVAGFENVWRSTNRGSSWNRISNFGGSQTIRQLMVAPSNSNVIYTCKNSNILRKTSNGGSTWSIVNSGLPNFAITDIEVHPHYEDSVWVSFGGYSFSSKVFVSGDGGNSWSNLSTNIPNLPVNDLVYDTVGHVLYAGTDVGVYYQKTSVSLGWIAYNTGLPNVIVREMEVHYGAQKLRAATYGRGMWESDLVRPLSTSIADQSVAIDNGFALAPNPTKDVVTLSWNRRAPNLLNLYDLKGQLIWTQSAFQGTQTQIDLSGLKQGIYLLEVNAYNQRFQYKVVKVN